MQYRQDSGNARCHGLGGDAGKALTCKVGLIRGITTRPQIAYNKGGQQSYSKYGIVLNHIDVTGRPKVCNPSRST